MRTSLCSRYSKLSQLYLALLKSCTCKTAVCWHPWAPRAPLIMHLSSWRHSCLQGRTALEAAVFWRKQEVANILLDHQVTIMTLCMHLRSQSVPPPPPPTPPNQQLSKLHSHALHQMYVIACSNLFMYLHISRCYWLMIKIVTNLGNGVLGNTVFCVYCVAMCIYG